MAETKRYYYCEDGETPVGPFSREKFQELLAKEVVAWEVWVTREDDSDWRTAADIEEFKDFDALVASGRAGANYQNVLDAAFVSTLEDEKRAQDLQSLQRASARIDLVRFREESDREEVPTGEKPSALWWLRCLRMKPVLIGLGFLACLALVFLVTHGMSKAGDEEASTSLPTIPAVAGAGGGGALGSVPPLPREEPETLPEPEVLESSPDGLTLANSRVNAGGSSSRPADFYQLARPYAVNVDSDTVSMEPGQRVRVIDRQPDMWTVEAGDVRFQVSPTDLRRDNSEGVSTVGTPATGDMAVERPSGGGVPAAALPRFSE